MFNTRGLLSIRTTPGREANVSIAGKKMCQVGGFLLLISVLFLALSVGSYSQRDPTWNHYMSHRGALVQNLGGIIGASLADGGFQLLGSSVFLLLGIGGVAAWSLMRGRLRTTVTLAWRGCLLLVAVATGSHLLPAADPFLGPKVLVGGVLGTWCAEVLVPYVNPSGAYLVVSSAGILALFIGVDYGSLYRTVRRGCRTISHYAHGVGAWSQRWLRTLGAGVRRGMLMVGRCLSIGGRVIRWCLPCSFLPSHPAVEDGPLSPLHLGEDMPPPQGLLAEENVEVQGSSSTQASRPTLWEPNADRPQAPVGSRASRRPRSPRQRPGATPLPSLDLLDYASASPHDQRPEDLQAQARILEQKLQDFGVEGEVVQVLPGPVITMYEFAPAPGVKVSKIVNLQDDLALVMRALSVRIVAPIPGKAVVGIEIPNRRRETVRLRDLLDSEEFRTSTSMLSLAVGKDILGKPVITDLALIPHLLIAGATGSGKSVGLNSMICSLLFRATPADVKTIMIDPKMLELSIYDGIPHLLIPVVTNPKQAAVALRRVVEEMERRYQLLAAKGVRSIAQYNQVVAEAQQQSLVKPTDDAARQEAAPSEKLPYLVVVIDELSDLMMVSSREVEDSLTRIAQMARAAGIHLIVATQRPSVDVLTGVIKANFPARMSFQVTSKTDSRTILDANGAEQLLGRGDMLFLAPGTSKSQRIHGAYVSEAEINRLVAAWKELDQPSYDDSFLEPSGETVNMEDEEYDEKYDEAVALVARTGQASISGLQRRLRVGYNRAARMIETMEKEGIIGPADGVRPREVLVRKDFDEV
jgi:S-DNA-T family DNA segregation ATPase FtsK/SpoIIIE